MRYNYDTIAWCYDRFSRLIFGGVQVDAQLALLPAIPAGASLLIIGGGTGWILEAIERQCPPGLTITYVDASAKMIALAKQKDNGGNKVSFITATIADAKIGAQYDVVLTPFLFDNFTQVDATHNFSVINSMLSPGGKWLYCDFQQTEKAWHKLLLKAMYTFFRLCCGVRAKVLPDIELLFKDGYFIKKRSLFMSGFITSIVYEKMIR